MITTRNALPADTAAMTDLLNEIIRIGGTTAHQRPFVENRMLHHYVAPEGLISCTIAEMKNNLAGFQCLLWPNDHEDPLPAGWAIIATFAKPGLTGKGIGTELFNATMDAARNAGVRTIDATIRADNEGGLRYYAKMGFRDYDRLVGIPLRDGKKVDRVRKRFDIL